MHSFLRCFIHCLQMCLAKKRALCLLKTERMRERVGGHHRLSETLVDKWLIEFLQHFKYIWLHVYV